MIKRIIYIAFIVVSISYAEGYTEPSVYGFDDFNRDISVDGDDTIITQKNDTAIINIPISDTPIIHNTQPITISTLQQEVEEQKQRIDGLTTIIEGLTTSVNELKQGNIDINSGEVVTVVEDTMVDDIPKSTYIVEAPKPQNIVKKIVQPIKKSNSLIFNEGVTKFMQKDYSQAQDRFIITDSKGYKVASSNYYLGEIAYYSADYENAIFFFKKSAGIDNKTSYIDTLLLHTGISFEKSGKIEKAKGFYKNILEYYPDSKSAKIAKSKLGKL